MQPTLYSTHAKLVIGFLLVAAVLPALPTTASTVSTEPGTGTLTVAAETRTAVRQLIGETLLNSQAYEYDRQLADLIGPRLTGSANYHKAVSWAEQQFKALGLSTVHNEEWTIPATWEPEVPATGLIVSPVDHTLHIVSLGWSPSTPTGGVTGKIVYVKQLTIEKLEEQKSELIGSIALFRSRQCGREADTQRHDIGIGIPPLVGALAIMGTGIANGTESISAHGFNGTIAPQP